MAEFDRWAAERPELEKQLMRWARGERVSFSKEDRALVLEMVRATHVLEAERMVGAELAQRLEQAREAFEAHPGSKGRRLAAEILGWARDGGRRAAGFDVLSAALRFLPDYAGPAVRLDPSVESVRELAAESGIRPETVLEYLHRHRAKVRRALGQEPEGWARTMMTRLLTALDSLPSSAKDL